MDQIISKLNELGVSATKKQISPWLSANSIDPNSITDAQIIALADHLNAAIAPTASDLATGGKVATCEPPSNVIDLDSIRKIGLTDGEKDAALLFEQYQNGYTEAFNRVVESRSGFREQLREIAIASIGRA